MIGDIFQPTHLLLILVVALLVLGPKRLPEVGRSLGRGIRDFRSALNFDDDGPNPAHTLLQPETKATPEIDLSAAASTTEPLTPAAPQSGVVPAPTEEATTSSAAHDAAAAPAQPAPPANSSGEHAAATPVEPSSK